MSGEGQNITSDCWFQDLIGSSGDFAQRLVAVKDFAYRSFDRIDADGNGFLSIDELEKAYSHDSSLDFKHRSFLRFILDNHEQIAEAHDDSDDNEKGLSREDLESYFNLIAALL